MDWFLCFVVSLGSGDGVEKSAVAHFATRFFLNVLIEQEGVVLLPVDFAEFPECVFSFVFKILAPLVCAGAVVIVDIVGGVETFSEVVVEAGEFLF